MSLFRLFKHHLSFQNADPLGDGLAEAIAAEKAEPEAITLEETPDGEQLTEQWAHVVEEVEKDPDWFSFADDE